MHCSLPTPTGPFHAQQHMPPAQNQDTRWVFIAPSSPPLQQGHPTLKTAHASDAKLRYALLFFFALHADVLGFAPRDEIKIRAGFSTVLSTTQQGHSTHNSVCLRRKIKIRAVLLQRCTFTAPPSPHSDKAIPRSTVHASDTKSRYHTRCFWSCSACRRARFPLPHSNRTIHKITLRVRAVFLFALHADAPVAI